jgi:hypothetical protein
MTTHENENSLFYYKPEAYLGVSILSPHAKPFIPRVQHPVVFVNPRDELIRQLRRATYAELVSCANIILAQIESRHYV